MRIVKRWLMALLLLCTARLWGQVTIPPRLPLDFPQYAAYEAPNAQLIIGKIIPLGFSPDGKFAYVTEPPDEACGCYFFEFHIQDLETDRVVYKKRVEIEGVDKPEWERVWRKYGTVFQAQLDSHHVELGKFQQQAFPIAVDTTLLKLDIRKTNAPSDFGDGGQFVAVAQIFLTSEDWGEKRVAKLNFYQGAVIDLVEGAYLKSPFEDRVVLILLRQSRGWEGPPNTIEPVVIGAQLKTRFPGLLPKTQPDSGN